MPHRLLVVEDDDNQRSLYTQEFQDMGYEVIEACDGRSAIETAAREKPDLVILDIHMPDMDGLQALSQLLASCGEHVPVIIHTAYSSYRSSYMSWAADAYLVKSPDLDELKDTVRSILEKVRQT